MQVGGVGFSCPLAILLLGCLVVLATPAQGSVSFFHDISREAHRHVELDYGGHHQRRRTQATSVFDEATDAATQDVSYSVRDTAHAPIRIKFDTSLLESRLGESAERDSVINEILESLPMAAAQWSQHLYVDPVRSTIDVAPDVCFGIYGDQVEPVSAGETDLLILVSGQEEFAEEDGESLFAVCGSSTLALASACTLDQFDRPIVGFVNFCLDHEVSSSVDFIQRVYGNFLGTELRDDHIEVSQTEIAVHELGHVLGFTSWMYKYFRHPDRTPRTERPFQSETIQCTSGVEQTAVFPSPATIRETIDPVTGRKSFNIVTPRVKQVARNLLGCDEVIGARLGEGETCLGSHWHERLFLGEIMSPVLTGSSENVLSPLTLALMEDTGWYRVDYRGADIPVFGLGAGCEFAMDACIQNDSVPDWGLDMFCDVPMSFNGNGRITWDSLNHAVCDPSHRWWTLCDLWDGPTVPEGFADFPESSTRYFSNENLVSSLQTADSCPIPVRSLGYDCTVPNADYVPYYPGEAVGEESRCIVASQAMGGGAWSFRPACMTTHCDSDLGKVVIRLDESTEEVCQEDGQIINLPDNTRLQCPRLASICPALATCPSGCSGRGVCNYGASPPVCLCDEGDVDTIDCFIDPTLSPTASPANGDDGSTNSPDNTELNPPSSGIDIDPSSAAPARTFLSGRWMFLLVPLLL